MTNKERQAYLKMWQVFGYRVLEALKPANKLWQKRNKKPLTWPDSVELIKWLTEEARKGRKG